MKSKANKTASRKSRALNFIYKFFVAAVILIGIGLLLYPTVADLYNRNHGARIIAGYEKSISELNPVDYQAMLDAAREYNLGLFNKLNRFQPSDDELEIYNQILDVTGTGVMGYVDIPGINTKLPVYHTVEETVLQIAAGHMPGTSFPIGESGTHAVLSGHSGLPSAKLFTNLEKLEIGQAFSMHVLDQIYYYEIRDINTVLPDEMDLLEISSDRDLITLITCTPYGVNSHRLLVTGERVDEIPEEFQADVNASPDSVQDADAESNDVSNTLALVLLAVVVIVACLLLYMIFGHGGSGSKSDASGDDADDNK